MPVLDLPGDQWLRPCTYAAGGLSSILGGGAKAKKAGAGWGEGIKKQMPMVTEETRDRSSFIQSFWLAKG